MVLKLTPNVQIEKDLHVHESLLYAIRKTMRERGTHEADALTNMAQFPDTPLVTWPVENTGVPVDFEELGLLDKYENPGEGFVEDIVVLWYYVRNAVCSANVVWDKISQAIYKYKQAVESSEPSTAQMLFCNISNKIHEEMDCYAIKSRTTCFNERYELIYCSQCGIKCCNYQKTQQTEPNVLKTEQFLFECNRWSGKWKRKWYYGITGIWCTLLREENKWTWFGEYNKNNAKEEINAPQPIGKISIGKSVSWFAVDCIKEEVTKQMYMMAVDLLGYEHLYSSIPGGMPIASTKWTKAMEEWYSLTPGSAVMTTVTQFDNGTKTDQWMHITSYPALLQPKTLGAVKVSLEKYDNYISATINNYPGIRIGQLMHIVPEIHAKRIINSDQYKSMSSWKELVNDWELTRMMGSIVDPTIAVMPKWIMDILQSVKVSKRCDTNYKHIYNIDPNIVKTLPDGILEVRHIQAAYVSWVVIVI